MRVRDVGQASFVTLVSKGGECLMHFDVGSPVSFNRHTLPAKSGVRLKDPSSGNPAPVVLSHWDWDHLHAALQVRLLRERPWVVPDQPMGPGAARLAHDLANRRMLSIWPGGAVRFPWGLLAGCSGAACLNDSGLAALVRLASGAVLLSGDAAYRSIPAALRSSVTVLVSTHHGARLASGDHPPTPVAQNTPWIISCGRGNTYGHPHPSSLAGHAATGWGAPIYTSSVGGSRRGDRLIR